MKRQGESARRTSKQRYAKARLHVLEALESRVLLDGALDEFPLVPLYAGSEVAPPVLVTVAGQGTPGTSWLTPASIRNWYRYNGVTFNNATIAGDGRGQTIAIIDWGHDATIADTSDPTKNDLDIFDKEYGVNGTVPTLYDEYGAASSFLAVYAQDGTQNSFLPWSSDPSLPPDAKTPGYGTDMEIALDVEWAHALAPAARIVLVEAHDNYTSNLTDAIDFVKDPAKVPGVSVISMSFGGSDSVPSNRIADTDLSQAGVTFVASTGDWGSYAGEAAGWGQIYGTVAGAGLDSHAVTSPRGAKKLQREYNASVCSSASDAAASCGYKADGVQTPYFMGLSCTLAHPSAAGPWPGARSGGTDSEGTLRVS